MTEGIPGVLTDRLRLSTGATTKLRTVPVTLGSGTEAVQLRLTASDARPSLRVEIELADAVGYWRPGGRDQRALPADWEPRTATSLVRSAPAGVLHAESGRALLGWAASESVAELEIRRGVSEENKTFVVEVEAARRLSRPLEVVLDLSGADLADVAPRLATWMSAQLPGTARRSGPAVRRPVYSTWYTFTQDLDHRVVLDEARRAGRLGCGSVFIDDGWQTLAHGRGYQGCGDRRPDRAKFPDLAATIAEIGGLGLETALWFAPLLLGEDSDAAAGLESLAPGRVPGLNCRVLDPRVPEVREHLASTALRLVSEYGARLLKIDFLEQAMIYRDTPTSGDLDDVGEAMDALLREIRSHLDRAGHPEVAFEFRQPYVSPAIARWGEILRAGDCPADSLANRLSTIDSRLFSAGQIVHSDPLM